LSASMARRRLALSAKLAATASAGGAAMPDSVRKRSREAWSPVYLAQGLLHLGEGLRSRMVLRMRCCSSAKRGAEGVGEGVEEAVDEGGWTSGRFGAADGDGWTSAVNAVKAARV